jgi:hypothetical protein
MTDFYMKQNDTQPTLVAALTETPSGGKAEAIDLTAAEKVYLIVREKGASDPTEPKFKKECSITSAEGGEVAYEWDAEDTDTSGEFNFEFEIVWAPGETETVPRQGYYLLDVEDDLG